MRLSLTIAAAFLAAANVAAPGHAQGGEFMWCQASADNGDTQTIYYSAFFAAGAWEAEKRARAFKSVVEDEEISAVSVKATCSAPTEYSVAVADRNAAMKAAPGTVLDWAG